MSDRDVLVRLIDGLMVEQRGDNGRTKELAQAGVVIGFSHDYVELIADAFGIRMEAFPPEDGEWDDSQHFSRDWLYDSFNAGNPEAFLAELETANEPLADDSSGSDSDG